MGTRTSHDGGGRMDCGTGARGTELMVPGLFIINLLLVVSVAPGCPPIACCLLFHHQLLGLFSRGWWR